MLTHLMNVLLLRTHTGAVRTVPENVNPTAMAAAPGQTMMYKFKRSCGYCLNIDCRLRGKPIFLMGCTSHTCEDCHHQCHVELERAKRLNEDLVYREVRLEFMFDPYEMRYRGLAIVRDEESTGTNVLTMYAPRIIGSRRATTYAEKILACLQVLPEEEAIYPRDFLVDLDKPIVQVRRDLEEMQYRMHYARKLSKPK